jgi:hypothetical protein
MQENKNLVQEALIQMKNVEEAIAENAKGILASTMKEEINQLVKESLSENEDEVVKEADDEMEDDIETDMEMSFDDESEVEPEDEESDEESFELDMDSEEAPIDLTHIEDEEELLKVFKAMGEDDGIIVKKDGEDIHLKDNDADTEYVVKLGEAENEKINIDENFNEMEHETNENIDDVLDAIFSSDSDMSDVSQDDIEDEEIVYEISLDDDEDMMESEDDDIMEESDDDDIMEESDDDDIMEESDDEESDDEAMMGESYNHKKSPKKETKEAKMSVKAKGLGLGKGPKFSYKKESGGFNTKMKEGPKSVGTGNAKKVKFGKGENAEVGKNKMVKKVEAKESPRTLGSGTNFRTPGGLPKPRAHSGFNANVKKESIDAEVSMLREKNEEYRKALNVFREKLNEVAIFNSNLAYATRLFTEHSTTKKEKINILRRFDSVESLKESKTLYKSIKDELSKTETKSINETVETKLNKEVSSGSATTLIESKTYENPQFLRMKDLMSKIR